MRERRPVRSPFIRTVVLILDRTLSDIYRRTVSVVVGRELHSVAAHLEPEILIIDEVLAVGDAQFQKKCVGKIEEVGRHGHTVLVVTHDPRIAARCERVIEIVDGRITSDRA